VEGLAEISLMAASPLRRDVLGFHELEHPFMPALAAEARLLGAAEGRAGVRDEAAVEADHPVVEPLADLHRALEIAAEDIGDQPVFGVIGAADRVVLVGEGLDRGDGPKISSCTQSAVSGTFESTVGG
jgi:hypothetical protein